MPSWGIGAGQALESNLRGCKGVEIMAHKIVALRVRYSGGGLTIHTLGASPRGTRFIIGEVGVPSGITDVAERKAAITAAVATVVAGSS